MGEKGGSLLLEFRVVARKEEDKKEKLRLADNLPMCVTHHLV